VTIAIAGPPTDNPESAIVESLALTIRRAGPIRRQQQYGRRLNNGEFGFVGLPSQNLHKTCAAIHKASTPQT